LKKSRERDLHFCLHLAGIVDSVTSLGGSVGWTDGSLDAILEIGVHTVIGLSHKRYISNPVSHLWTVPTGVATSPPP